MKTCRLGRFVLVCSLCTRRIESKLASVCKLLLQIYLHEVIRGNYRMSTNLALKTIFIMFILAYLPFLQTRNLTFEFLELLLRHWHEPS